MKKHSFKKTLADTKLMLKYIWNGDKYLIPLKIISLIIGTLQTAIGTLYIKWIIDSIVLKESFEEVIWIIIMVQVISLVLCSISTIISNIIMPRREYKLRNYLQNLFIGKAMKQDLECYEDFKFYDNYTKAIRYADSKALDFLNLIFSIIKNIFGVILISSIIVTFDPFVFIIILVMVAISFFDQNKSNRLSHEQYEAEESINRKSEYIKRVSHFKDFAKEVRLYNLGPFLINKLNETFIEKYKIYKDANTKYWRFKYIISVLNTLIIAPALLSYIAFRTIAGAITLGSFAIMFSSCYEISGQLAGVINSVDRLNFESEYYVTHLRGILDYKPLIENDIADKKSIAKINSIEFKNVSFQYPHHDKMVLTDISFNIESGEKVALVGRNGAGKSTIIKLLLRLYDVTSGEIFVNDINIKEYNIIDLRKCFSAVMQDYNIFSFSVRENISMGEYYEEKAIQESLEFSEIADKVNGFDRGVDVNVGRDFDEDGVNFSGGERQKLSLSRAHIRHSSVMVLDEANSALDPFAEYKLNEKIMQMTLDQISVFVSHRLTTTVRSDKIIMIENGRIIEIGTHEQLCSNPKSQYRAMFEKQAQAYEANKAVKDYE